MTIRKRTRADQTYSGFKAVTRTVNTDTVETHFPALKAQMTRQLEDEFRGHYGTATAGFTVLEPLYPPVALNKHAMASGVLRTCIEAMATNIDGFGYSLEYVGPEGGQESAEAQEEYDRVMGVLDHPNGEYSLIDLRRRFRIDKEASGYGTIEIVRNPDDGFPDMLHHVPSYTVRMTSQDQDYSMAYRYMPRPGSTDNMMQVRTRFRRLVQIVGGKRVYFREVGDTRPIDYATGRPMAGATADPERAASDMVLDMHYAPGSRYGAPRWIGDLRSVLGIQEAENTNLGYFKDNGIPAMMLLVLGGAMTDQAQRDFKSMVQQARGSGMQNKIVMLDIRGDEQAASDKGMIQRPDVRLEPLMQVRQNDAFFQTYEQNSAKKVRSSFRLPAIFTGLTEEVRMAVAQASLTLAESQVFGPERAQTDDLFNYQILTYNGVPMRFWRFKSNPPRIHDPAEVMKALSTFESVGAMTPNIAIDIANALFDMRIPLIEDGWGDMPFSFTQTARVDPVTGQFKEDAPPTPPPALDPAQQPALAPSAPVPPAPGAEVKTRKRKRVLEVEKIVPSRAAHRDRKRAGMSKGGAGTARSIASARPDQHEGTYVTVGEGNGA